MFGWKLSLYKRRHSTSSSTCCCLMLREREVLFFTCNELRRLVIADFFSVFPFILHHSLDSIFISLFHRMSFPGHLFFSLLLSWCLGKRSTFKVSLYQRGLCDWPMLLPQYWWPEKERNHSCWWQKNLDSAI